MAAAAAALKSEYICNCTTEERCAIREEWWGIQVFRLCYDRRSAASLPAAELSKSLPSRPAPWSRLRPGPGSDH